MANLATVQEIIGIKSITGADKIELALVLGWQCVVEKGKYKEGDKVIYVQIDTLLPQNSAYDFLEKSSKAKEYGVAYGEHVKPGIKYHRLKTARFKGELSQGLILPIDMSGPRGDDMEIGSDVSRILGIIKYEKPFLAKDGDSKGNFPSFIIKTDEERIQNVPDALEQFHGKQVYETLKVDGTSATYYYLLEKNEFGACSKNLQKKLDTDGLHALIARKFNIMEHLTMYCQKIGKSLAIQGEIAGPSIQGNPLKLPEERFFMFTAQVIKEGQPGQFVGLEFLAELAGLSIYSLADAPPIRTVPILASYIFDKEKHTQEYYLNRVEEISYNGVTCVEGIVVRTTEEYPNPPRGLRRWSFKVINNDYKD